MKDVSRFLVSFSRCCARLIAPAIFVAFAFSSAASGRVSERLSIACDAASSEECVMFAQAPQSEETSGDNINTTSAPIGAKLDKKPSSSKVEAPPKSERDIKKTLDVQLKGFRYLKHRYFSASGNDSAFISKAGYSQSRKAIEQGMSMVATAKVGGKGTFEGTFNQMPFQDLIMKTKFTYGPTVAHFGQSTGSLDGGDLSTFSKSIEGVAVNYEKNGDKIKFLTSKSKSQTITKTFSGRNIKGPYDLNERDLASNIIVRLNNETLTPDKYILEPFLGQITFFDVLGPDDVVTVTFDQNLLGSLNEGNLEGFSYDHAPKNSAFSYGFSSLKKGANLTSNASSSESDVVMNKSANLFEVSIPSSYIPDSGIILLRRNDPFKGSETIEKNGVALKSGVDYNVVPVPDNNFATSSKILEGYATGKFYLKDKLADGDVVKISYTYYLKEATNCYLGFENKQQLTMSSGGNEAYLSVPGTIYYGSEKIYSCPGSSPSSAAECDLMDRFIDYQVDEKNNKISFTNPPLTTNTNFFNGCVYPSSATKISPYDHTVLDYRIKYEPSKNYSVSYEAAISKADVSTKPIAVLNQTLREPSATDLDCSGIAINTPACVFPVNRENLVPGSIVMYKNDRISNDSVVDPFKSYTVDLASGTVALKFVVPANTRLIVDYQYNPPFLDHPVKGKLSKMNASYNGKNTKLKYELRTGDTYFTAVGAENNLEISRMSFAIDQTFSDAIKFSMTSMNTKSALDILKNNKSRNNQRGYKLSLKPKFVKNLDIALDTRDQSDDYNPRRVDSKETKKSIATGGAIPFLKKADFTFSLSSAEVSNKTFASTDKRSTTNRTIGTSYSPSKRLSISARFLQNEINTSAKDLSFSSSNASRNIDVKWDVTELISSDISLDTQKVTDSRSTVAGSQVNKSKISIKSKPFGRVKDISISYSAEDRPSVSSVSTGSNNTSLNLGYRVSKSIGVSPKFSKSTTKSGATSSDNNSSTWLFEYLPPGKPYRADFTLTKSTTTSNRGGGSGDQSNSGWTSTIGYTPSKIMNYSVNVKKDSQSAALSGDYNTLTFGAKTTRSPADGLQSQYLTLQRILKSGSVSQTDTTVELGNDRKLSKILDLNMLFRYSSLANEVNHALDYSGFTLETTIRATF